MNYNLENRLKMSRKDIKNIDELLNNETIYVKARYEGNNSKVENKEYDFTILDGFNITLIREPEKINVDCSDRVLVFIVRDKKSNEVLYKF